jgi:hypothetical protein
MRPRDNHDMKEAEEVPSPEPRMSWSNFVNPVSHAGRFPLFETRSSFEALWGSRVGPAVAAELRRNSYMRLALGPLLAASGAATARLVPIAHRSALGVAATVILLASAISLFMLVRRSQERLARLLSVHFAVTLEASELPKLRLKTFDAWCAKRGLNMPRETRRTD